MTRRLRWALLVEVLAFAEVGCARAAGTGHRPQASQLDRRAIRSSVPEPCSSAARPSGTPPARPTVPRRFGEAQASDGVPPDCVLVRARGKLGRGRATLRIRILPPPNGTLTEGAPLYLGAWARHIAFPPPLESRLDTEGLPLELPMQVGPEATGPALVDLSYYVCTEGENSACRMVRAKLAVELDIGSTNGKGEAYLEHQAPDR